MSSKNLYHITFSLIAHLVVKYKALISFLPIQHALSKLFKPKQSHHLKISVRPHLEQVFLVRVIWKRGFNENQPKA